MNRSVVVKKIEENSCDLIESLFNDVEIKKNLMDHKVYYSFTKKNKTLKKEVDIEKELLDKLPLILSNTKKEVESGLFSINILKETMVRSLFYNLLEVDIDSFKKVIKVFGKITSNENIYTSTENLRHSLIRTLLKNPKINKEKIEYILNDNILNKNDNICDKNIIKDLLFERNKNAIMEYNSYIINCLYFLNKEEIKPDLLKGMFPVNKKHLNPSLFIKQKIPPKNILPFLTNNYLKNSIDVNFLISYQNILNDKIKKKVILDYLENNVTEEDKKEIILASIYNFNIKNFLYIIKKYPEELLKISEKDVFNFQAGKYFYNSMTVPPKGLIEEKYGITLHSSKEESILKIINHEQSLLEIKILKKTIKSKSNKSIVKKRI